MNLKIQKILIRSKKIISFKKTFLKYKNKQNFITVSKD